MRIEHDKVRTRISIKPDFCMSIDHSKMVCVRLKETLLSKFCLHLCSKYKFRFPTLLQLFIMQKALQFPFLLFLSLYSCCCVWMVCQKFFWHIFHHSSPRMCSTRIRMISLENWQMFLWRLFVLWNFFCVSMACHVL